MYALSMQQLYFLFSNDAREIISWFRAHTIAKLVVIGAFLLLGGGIAWSMYTVGLLFFRNVASYNDVGLQTAQYIIHSATLLVVWFALGSSIASFWTLLYTNKKNVSNLLALPIPIQILITHLHLKMFITSFILLNLFLTPLMFAYSQAFTLSLVALGIRFAGTLLCLTLITLGTSSLLSFWVLSKATLKPYFLLFGILLYVVSGWSLIKLIFPTQLLTAAETNSSFALIYSQLPINNLLSPFFTLTQFVTQNTGAFIYPLVLGCVLSLLAINFATKQFLTVINRIADTTKSHNWIPSKPIRFRHFALIHKDWLSIIRLPSETGYALFLISMVIVFFTLLSQAKTERLEQYGYQSGLTVFAFLWLLFFVTAFLLRIVYPLMSREGKARWLLFSLPVNRFKLLIAKISLSLVLSIPFIIISTGIWSILSYTKSHALLLMFTTTLTIVWTTVSASILGGAFPTFSLSQEPEKASTTAVGLGTFTYLIVISGFVSFSLYQGLHAVQPLHTVVETTLLVFVATTLSLTALVVDRLHKIEM